MKIKNIIGMLLTAIFFVISTGHVSAVENTVEVTLPVMQKFELPKQEDSNIDTIGVYELKSTDNNSPMPTESKENSYTFQIDGADKQTMLQFKYDRTGIYKYQLYQVIQDRKNYIYDRNTYDLIVYVKNAENGKLTYQIIVQNSNGEKCSEVIFKNRYQREMIENKPLTLNQTTSKPNNLPKTGNVASHLGLLGIVFVASGSILLSVNYKKWKNKNKVR